jgi:hypothetical protein
MSLRALCVGVAIQIPVVLSSLFFFRFFRKVKYKTSTIVPLIIFSRESGSRIRSITLQLAVMRTSTEVQVWRLGFRASFGLECRAWPSDSLEFPCRASHLIAYSKLSDKRDDLKLIRNRPESNAVHDVDLCGQSRSRHDYGSSR